MRLYRLKAGIPNPNHPSEKPLRGHIGGPAAGGACPGKVETSIQIFYKLSLMPNASD